MSDRVAFTSAQSARVLAAARALELPVTAVCRPPSDFEGAAVPGRFGARSADHLDHSGAESLPLAMHLACRLFGLPPGDVPAGPKRHAARALGLAGVVGVVGSGAAADLVART